MSDVCAASIAFDRFFDCGPTHSGELDAQENRNSADRVIRIVFRMVVLPYCSSGLR